MYVMGFSCFYHDSAAALIRNGEVLAAAEEERFTGMKHETRFPVSAARFCLEEAAITATQLDAIVFYEYPLLRLDRGLRTSLSRFGDSYSKKRVAQLLSQDVWLENHMKQAIGGIGKLGYILQANHHLSHASSAFFPSKFKNAAILTIDGAGEWATSSIGLGIENRVELIKEGVYPHSIGLAYSAFTRYCGFRANHDEYKLMGLAASGKPRFLSEIRDKLVNISPAGELRLSESFLENGIAKITETIGSDPRDPNTAPIGIYADVAASIQAFTEDVVCKFAELAVQQTGYRKLCYAGGVAFNVLANSKLLSRNIVDDIWIQPAAGDAGGALGAAYLGYHHHFERSRCFRGCSIDRQKGSLLGPSFLPNQVSYSLEAMGVPYRRVENESEAVCLVASAIAKGEFVGVAIGRMEFGPRSLGARSILADPRHLESKARLNQYVKRRELFRPFGAAVLQEDAQQYFLQCRSSPYMQLVAEVINTQKNNLAAVTHIDGTCRIQTVSDPSSFLYKVLVVLRKLTGISVVLNTSLNVSGDPIALTPEDACMCFHKAGLDLLLIEDCVLSKADNDFSDIDFGWEAYPVNAETTDAYCPPDLYGLLENMEKQLTDHEVEKKNVKNRKRLRIILVYAFTLQSVPQANPELSRRYGESVN